MDLTVWIALLVAVIAVVAGVILVLLGTSILVEPGTIALLLKRGKATRRAFGPGRHFVAPWRKVTAQIYPSRELVLVAGGRSVGDVQVEYVDDPLRLHLGDKVFAEVSYTIRCQLDVGKVRHVHDSFGPAGIWAALRDITRATLLAAARDAAMSVDDAYGERLGALEQRFSAALGTALGEAGFVLRMFSLREFDLGETGEVIQAVVRADAELQREQAYTKVRTARLENDVAACAMVDGADIEMMLHYRRLEAWGSILARWDGDRPIPAALTMPLLAPPIQAQHDAAAIGEEHLAEPAESL